MFAKFYEIPSLPFQDIENQSVADGLMDMKTVYPTTNAVWGGGGGGYKYGCFLCQSLNVLMFMKWYGRVP